jgi:hypothetical protein
VIKISRTAFNRTLCTITNINEQKLDSIGGSLRKEGMISIGGRVPNAMHITLLDARNIILGLLAADNASQAAKVVKVVSNFKSKDGVNFGEAVTTLLADPDTASNVSYISVFRNSGKAVIGWSKFRPQNDVGENAYYPYQQVFTAEGADIEISGLIIEATLPKEVLNAIVATIHKTDKNERIINLR